jgi:hypothetical protein
VPSLNASHRDTSPNATQVSDSLLHDPESNGEVHYFCAQTLKKKSQRDYEELPEGVSRCELHSTPPSTARRSSVWDRGYTRLHLARLWR